MNEEFGPVYADSYDQLYGDKNYSTECDLLEKLFQSYSLNSVRNILDLGCGTGNHAVPLAERGYKVTGVDRSADMLAQARHKLQTQPDSKNLILECADIRGLSLNATFDAVLIMFAVLGYQQTNQDVVSALSAARRHLKPGGLLIFDVWYGPAVLANRPSERIKIIQTDRGHILRASSGILDTRRHLCKVEYLLWMIEKDRLVQNTKESHLMRYFFPLELEFFLQSTGFAATRLGSFPNFLDEPDENSWNVLQVARAVE